MRQHGGRDATVMADISLLNAKDGPQSEAHTRYSANGRRYSVNGRQTELEGIPAKWPPPLPIYFAHDDVSSRILDWSSSLLFGNVK